MSFNIAYVFTAVDKFSDVAKNINKSISSISNNVNKLGEKLNHIGENLKRTGESIALYLDVPITAFGVESFREFRNLNYAIIATQGALRNMGGSANLTFEQIKQAADSLAESSFFSRTQIYGEMSSQLLKFKHVSGDTFLRAQKDIVDYAQFTGQSLQGVTNLVGRALDNPARGLLRLSRIGITLTKGQEEAVKLLSTTGHLAEVQNFILKQLEKRFHDVYEDMDKDPFFEFNKGMEKLKENVGEVEAEAFAPLVEKINEIIGAFNRASPETKKFIIQIAGFVAIIGPTLIMLGLFITLLGSVGRSLAILVNPITLVIAGFAALAYIMYDACEKADLVKYAIAAVGAAILTAIIGIRLGLGPISWLIAGIQLLATAFIYVNSHIDQFVALMNKAVGFINKITGFHLGSIGNNQQIAFGESATTFAGHAPLGVSAAAQSHANINVNINDPNKVIKSVSATTKGPAQVNVGRNMAHVG